ncbi:hypothetical protein [Streptomyces sp. NBC_01451]|uniref:hypothetical protein n=1 Tax=Streptomyces sp. NBC_01451 TaxID=2903872 RepID=UPI002E330599|nr:hypothetical protein [Streptomyces sp. NBC_01451]
MSELRPVLRTPTGGAESQPSTPTQWHGYPYVWAWNVALGATSRTFIENECKAAAEAGAPPDAVYRTRDDDKSMPGEWLTVGMITMAQRQTRVREYAQALVDWQDALKAHSRPPAVQQLQDAKQPTDERGQPGQEYEYAIVFRPTHMTGVVKAGSLREAYQKLAPGPQFAPSGYGVLDLPGQDEVLWHVGFDAGRGQLQDTTDPRLTRTPQPAEAPAAPERPTAPAAAVDTAATPVPTGRGVKVIPRTKQQP